VSVVQDHVSDAKLQQCVVRRTEKLALARKLDRPVLVTYPLVFQIGDTLRSTSH